MASFIRFVSLIGVVSAGFYVLYLTQTHLSEPQTLTQNESESPAPVTLGAEGELTALATTVTPWKGVDENPEASESAFPSETDADAMFSASTPPATTEVSEAPPGWEGGLDFRGAETAAGTVPEAGPTIVTAAADNTAPRVITLTANDDPFTEDATKQPADREPPPAFESADPFAEQDPFKDEPGSSEKPASAPKPAPEEFDPFGDDEKTPEPFTTGKNADEFPGLNEKPAPAKPSTTATKPGTASEKNPVHTPVDDPFAPFSDEPPVTTEGAKRLKPAPAANSATQPEVSSDPFPEFPGETPPPETKPLAPKPTPAADPFGEPFPALESTEPKPNDRPPLKPIEAPNPSDDPFGESLTTEPRVTQPPAEFPDFPGELPKTEQTLRNPALTQPAKTLESGFDPFAAETPAPKPTGAVATPPAVPVKTDDFPAFEPTTPEKTEAPADRTGSLPSLEEFQNIDEKLSRRIEESERNRTASPAPEFPGDLPATEKPAEPVREAPADFPGDTAPDEDETTPPKELRSGPTGIVPSLTDLQGDGVLPPETPHKVQLPDLEIQKSAPEKAVLNQPFVYTIAIKNVGQAAANEVTVQDQIPKGANLTGTIPQAELVGRRLVWKLGRIEPGMEQKVSVRIVPVESGPIGSVATVNFVAEVGAETVVEHPEVAFRMTLPPQADVGDVVECKFEIENQGSKVVSGIVLRDIIPAGMYHPAGNDLENPLGDLQPAQKLTEILELKILKAGEHVNQAVLTAEGGLEIRQQVQLEAAGNRLAIMRRGPKERFVGRPAIYQNVVKNVSQETVRDAIVIEKLPLGMQFLQAGQGGQYHAASGEIFWKIEEIAPGQAMTLDIQMTPVKPGVGESLVRVRESQGKEIQTVSHTQVRSYASIGLEVTEFDQPVLVGDTVVMRIEATNRGNASAETVQLRAKVPPTLQLMTVRGKTRFRVEGRDVVFETLQALPAGATEIIELELEAAAAAKAEVAVAVQSRGMTRPLVKTADIPVHARQ